MKTKKKKKETSMAGRMALKERWNGEGVRGGGSSWLVLMGVSSIAAEKDRQTHRQTDTQTDRHTDTQTDRDAKSEM